MTSDIDRVGIFRSAFRQICRHPGLDGDDRVRGEMNLVRRARSEPFADLILRALLSELEWSLDRDDVISERALGDVMETAARKLRGEGRAECPTCRTPLSGPIDWNRWRVLREAGIREAQAKEGAA
jgi:hypothetical protein